MELDRLFEELEMAAAKVDIEVRVEHLRPGPTEGGEPRGGLCVLRGHRVILVDERGSMTERIATLAVALARVDLEHIYLPPLVRATIGAHRRHPLKTEGQRVSAGRSARPLAKARRRSGEEG